MLRAIADTHTVVWYLFDDVRLSSTARTFIDTTRKTGDQIGFSTISLAEIVYLVEKSRIPKETLTRLFDALDRTDSILSEVVFDRRIAEALSRVQRVQVPELPDRIITATALHLNIPLLSRDGKIRASAVETVW